MNGPLLIAALVAGFVLLTRPARGASPPNASGGAASSSGGPGNSGPQTVDLGNPIAGAPVFNLPGVLQGRHLGVDNTGSSLNAPPTTPSAGTPTAPSTPTSGTNSSRNQPNLASNNYLNNPWIHFFGDPFNPPNLQPPGLYASGVGFQSGAFKLLQLLDLT